MTGPEKYTQRLWWVALVGLSGLVLMMLSGRRNEPPEKSDECVSATQSIECLEAKNVERHRREMADQLK